MSEFKINIIDPSSTEFNRGSFCYAPYLVYNRFSRMASARIRFFEAFRPEDIDTIPDATINIVALWSYPQVETALLLNSILPFTYGKSNVCFVGFSPLIDHLGLPHIRERLGVDPLCDNEFLQIAMRAYPQTYRHFGRLLLSDCDMHLKELDDGAKVHPLFTTYGCPNGCAFCPSTENCGYSRFVLEKSAVFSMLEECAEQGVRHIHFTDEDFFYHPSRANDILEFLDGRGFRMIALGSSQKVLQFIDRYGTEVIRRAGLEVIEIGFESGSTVLSDNMGAGKSYGACLELAEKQHAFPFHIFWLVQTFFPGETIGSLNETGCFMDRYGLKMDDVVGRLRTNGTDGGLGQYFQPYHGLPIYKSLEENGLFLTARPVRLLPSYIPNSFLDSVVSAVDPKNYILAEVWARLYGVALPSVVPGMTPGDVIRGRPVVEQMRKAIAFALLARKRAIT